MLENLFRRPRVRQRIRENPHGSVLEQFADYLTARGHRPDTAHQYVFAAEHFAGWLGRRRINDRAAKQFIKTHLPVCRCKPPAPRTVKTVRAALNRLLEMLGPRVVGRINKSPADRLLRRYANHLEHVQGLAPATVHYRLRYARTMISHFRVRHLRDLKTWRVDQVRQFVAGEGQRCQPSSGQVLASSIRSFMRFLLLHRLNDRDLASAVPSFANWRLASLPETIGGEELERLIPAKSSMSSIDLRDRAIILCLVELGLRASDVSGIELDGLDLGNRVIWLRRRKQRESAGLPISPRVGAAIGTYVRRGRPICSTSSLFVSHRAPLGKAMTPIGIRDVVIRTAAKAGLANRVRGTNVIRHSVASRWIQSGATMKQIADLLGHRSIDTTSIYAKVDLKALTQVALRWPITREVSP